MFERPLFAGGLERRDLRGIEERLRQVWRRDRFALSQELSGSFCPYQQGALEVSRSCFSVTGPLALGKGDS